MADRASDVRAVKRKRGNGRKRSPSLTRRPFWSGSNRRDFARSHRTAGFADPNRLAEILSWRVLRLYSQQFLNQSNFDIVSISGSGVGLGNEITFDGFAAGSSQSQRHAEFSRIASRKPPLGLPTVPHVVDTSNLRSGTARNRSSPS